MSKVPVAVGAVVIAATAAFIAPWEGRRLTPYKDIVGVWTVCEGITRNVEQRRYSPAECDVLLSNEAAIHLRGIAKCIHRVLPQNQWIALGSWSYNVGVPTACGSTLVRQINAGRPPEVWCQQLLRWDYAGGKRVRGLTNRRKAELKVCLGA